jgi:hypothetical protein
MVLGEEMKIAICLSGQPRLTNEAYANHLQTSLVDGNMVYIHGWWDESHRGKVFMFHSTETFGNLDMAGAFVESYKPKAFTFEDYESFDLKFCKSHNYDTWQDVPQKHYDIFTPSLLYGQLSQTSSIMKSVKLAFEDGADVIVRSRPDVVIGGRLKQMIESIPLQEDTVYFQSSMEGGHIYCGEFANNPCDWFYCGTASSMKKYTESSHKIIYDECKSGVRHVREMALIAAQRAGLNIVLCNFGAIVMRQLSKNEHHRKIENYYNEFDSSELVITHNHDMWPLFHDKIDFKFLRS